MNLQDPKYAIVDGQIVNRASGKPIPAHVPIMIFVATDAIALNHAIKPYAEACERLHAVRNVASAQERVQAFERFAAEHPGEMKVPDTTVAPAPGCVEKFGILMHPCQSSNVAGFGYDVPRRVLALEFKGGKVYHYKDVPQHVYDGLIEAESRGSYAAANITGKFEGTRMEQPATAGA
jgi:hypothetical protein